MFESFYMFKLNRCFNKITKILDKKTESYIDYVSSFEEFQKSLAKVYAETTQLKKDYEKAYAEKKDEALVKGKIQLYIAKQNQYNALLERFKIAESRKEEMVNQIKSLNFDKNAIDAKKQMLEAELNYIKSNNLNTNTIHFEDVFKDVDAFVSKSLYSVKAGNELTNMIDPNKKITEIEVDEVYNKLKK